MARACRAGGEGLSRTSSVGSPLRGTSRAQEPPAPLPPTPSGPGSAWERWDEDGGINPEGKQGTTSSIPPHPPRPPQGLLKPPAPGPSDCCDSEDQKHFWKILTSCAAGGPGRPGVNSQVAWDGAVTGPLGPGWGQQVPTGPRLPGCSRTGSPMSWEAPYPGQKVGGDRWGGGQREGGGGSWRGACQL